MNQNVSGPSPRPQNGKEKQKKAEPGARKEREKDAWLSQKQSQYNFGDRFIPFRKDEEQAKSAYALLGEEERTMERAYEEKFPSYLAKRLFSSVDCPSFEWTQNQAGEVRSQRLFKNSVQKRPSHFQFQDLTSFGNSFGDCQMNQPITSFLQRSEASVSHCGSAFISSKPFKVLDAPGLLDDFYFDLLDWGKQNLMAVSLANRVYSWNAETLAVSKISEFSSPNKYCTSLKWNGSGAYLSLGTSEGSLEIWDPNKNQKVTEFRSHSLRVGKIQWLSEAHVVTGSRDNHIIHQDIRSPQVICRIQKGHQQEVCGLRWSKDCELLASGGNDNKILLWSLHRDYPVLSMKYHNSAVKALEWNPHERGMLLSGGGTNDKTIKVLNTRSAQLVHSVNVGHQVCNLVFSPASNEFVSTYGFTNNEIGVWNYPDLVQKATLEGHSKRVLYVGISPDHDKIATGAGDEVVKFWEVFPFSNGPFTGLKTSPQSIHLR